MDRGVLVRFAPAHATKRKRAEHFVVLSPIFVPFDNWEAHIECAFRR
jgi:hypothetical protein